MTRKGQDVDRLEVGELLKLLRSNKPRNAWAVVDQVADEFESACRESLGFEYFPRRSPRTYPFEAKAYPDVPWLAAGGEGAPVQLHVPGLLAKCEIPLARTLVRPHVRRYDTKRIRR